MNRRMSVARPLPRHVTMQALTRMKRTLTGAVLISIALTGCSADKKADAAQPKTRREGSVDPRPSVVETPAQPYRVIDVVQGSTLSGTIDFEGQLPPDSVVAIPPDVPGCGHSVTARAVEHTGTRIGGAVVWIADIRSGKPLPVERRFELANRECLLTPRVQAVLTPATLNMASEDAALHTNHIIDVATGELQGIAPFNDNGEVVPFDKILTKPAQLEISCQIHPWAKAWILAFDHPYFATSERNGSFSIDNVPPGTYRVRAWHPRLGQTDQSITIVAGQPASLAMKLGTTPSGAETPQASGAETPRASPAVSR